MNIAAQLYTLREFLKTPEDIASTLKKVKQIGYSAVQVSGVGPIDNAALKALADEEGLTICATHVPYGDLTGNIDGVIEKHRIWDCKYVGLGGLPQEYRTSREGYETFAREATAIGKKLKEAGLQFIYHNHDFEFVKFGGQTGMDILFEQTDPDAVHFEIDVFWVQAGGGDPSAWVKKVEGRMKVVHLKDMKVTNNRGEQLFAEVGEGNMNFPRILQTCVETGVEWGAVEQDNCYGRDPFESLAISLRNLQALGFGN